MSLLHLACIAAALVAIDGPLVQRASAVDRASQSSTIPLSLELYPELPTGFSGPVKNLVISPHEQAAELFREYLAQSPMRTVGDRCTGTVRTDPQVYICKGA